MIPLGNTCHHRRSMFDRLIGFVPSTAPSMNRASGPCGSSTLSISNGLKSNPGTPCYFACFPTLSGVPKTA